MKRHEVGGSMTRPRGVALIFALLLLVVLTVLAVGTFSSVGMQERMSSNANLQALAFEAASAGVAESVDFWLDDETSNWPDEAECFRGLGRNWATEWTAPQRLEVQDLPLGFVVQYQTRLGCFEAGDWVPLDNDDPNTVSIAPPVQLLALSQGLVFRSNDGETAIQPDRPIATRQIEVRLERRGGEPPDFCALNFCPIEPDSAPGFAERTLEMPTSDDFSIDGGIAGCPASFPGPDADRAEGQLRERQLQRYQPTPPGIVESDLKGILNDAEKLARAVNSVKVGIRAWEKWDKLDLAVSSYPGLAEELVNLELDGETDPNPFGACKGQIEPGNLTECPTGITGFHYIAGDVYMGPCTFSNFMIIEGDFLINGNPIYTEPLLVLGGTMETRGWGNAENSNIAVVQNLFEPSSLGSIEPAYKIEDVKPGKCQFRVAGGGRGELKITDKCPELQEPWENLNSCLNDLDKMAETGSLLEDIQTIITEKSGPDLNFDKIRLAPDIRFSVPQCSGDPLAADRRNVIASWREFIDTGRWNDVPLW